MFFSKRLKAEIMKHKLHGTYFAYSNKTFKYTRSSKSEMSIPRFAICRNHYHEAIGGEMDGITDDNVIEACLDAIREAHENGADELDLTQMLGYSWSGWDVYRQDMEYHAQQY